MNGIPAPRLGSIHSAILDDQDRCEVSVYDQRTHQTVSWHLHVSFHSRPIKREQREIGRHGKLFALIIRTDKNSIAARTIEETNERIVAHLNEGIGANRLEVIELAGESASAESILKTIDRLPINSLDSLLVYVLGEDAYDPRFATSDASQGHFFRIDSGDLLRRTLWDHLDSTPARLRALVSDNSHSLSSSSNPSVANDFRNGRSLRHDLMPQPTNLEWLLLGHRGRVDINAAARNRMSDAQGQSGGWFTHCFCSATRRRDDWQFVPLEMRATLEEFVASRHGTRIDNARHAQALRVWLQELSIPEIRLHVTRDPSFANRRHSA